MASPLSIPSKSPATTSPSPSPSSQFSSSSPPPLKSPSSPSPSEPTIPPLHQAAQTNDLSFLSHYPSPSSDASTSPPPHLDINLVDSQGITALHWASINGHLLFVKTLLNLGAKVDYRGGELSGTPLMWASRNGHLPIVHLLLQHSSDPTLTDSQSFNCLHLAVHSSSAYLLAYLLFTMQPISVDTQDQEGHTSLSWAAYQGDAISVELLLKAGASPNRTDHQGLNPLHWAVTKGNTACIKRIIEEGAELDKRDHQGKTARDMSVELKSFASYKRALLELGMDERGKELDRPIKDPKKVQWAVFAVTVLGMGGVAKTLELSSYWWLGWILMGIECWGIHWVVTKQLLGVKEPSQSDKITKSNYLCAIIVGSLVWVGWVWVTRYLYVPDYGPTQFSFFLAYSLCAWNFYRAITLNPGYVPHTTSDIALKDTIEGLVENGRFNGMSFCLTCMVKRLLRSKHSYATGRCVGRFDHYCPWVWNDIGVDNHRQFLIFVSSLVIGILLFARLSAGYFSLSPSLPSETTCSFPRPICTASNYDTFALSITIWAALQLSWTLVLLGIQVWQICKQVTTLEVSNLGRYGYMGGKPGISAPHQQGASSKFPSSIPAATDHLLNASGTSGDSDVPSSDPASLSHAPSRATSSRFSFILKLLGLDRFTSTHKALLHSHSHSHPHSHSHSHSPRNRGEPQENPFDLGVRKNCVDFWTRGGELGVRWNDSEWEMPQGGFRRMSRMRQEGNEGGRVKSPYERVALEEV